MRRERMADEEFMEWAPYTCTTVAMHHLHCENGGVDRKKRLYITRRANGVVLAYCHNCQKRGWRAAGPKRLYNDDGTPIESAFDVPPDTTSPVPMAVDEYYHGSYRISDALKMGAPVVLVKWVEKFGVAPHVMDMDGVRYRSSNGTVLFPSFTCDGDVVGLQSRSLFGKIIKTYGKVEPHIFNPFDSPLLVIVEDRISGMKLVQEANCATLCMHGSKAIDSVLAHKLVMMFDEFLVWYDMDNPSVNEAAYKTRDALAYFTDKAKVVEPSAGIRAADPKLFSGEDLEKVIANWRELMASGGTGEVEVGVTIDE